MPKFNITIRPDTSRLLNYIPTAIEQYSQWPLNGRNSQAYGFTVRVVKNSSIQAGTEHSTHDHRSADISHLSESLMIENPNGDEVKIQCIDEQLVITSIEQNSGLCEGDVIQSFNGVVSPTFAKLYQSMCSGETLVLEVNRGGVAHLLQTTNLKRLQVGNHLLERMNKRIYITNSRQIEINSLPDAALERVASFMSRENSLLFAAAMSQYAAQSILGSEPVQELDFVGIDKKLAKRLNDNDIRDILIRIDAINNVVRLKMTNCVKMIGYGLEPLRRSKKLELLDLSLVAKSTSPYLRKEPWISEHFVVPILCDIARQRSECQLKYVQYPRKWSRNIKVSKFDHAFHNSSTIQRQCMFCDQNKSNWMFQDSWGSVEVTCSVCLKGSCRSCVEDHLEDKPICCNNCEKSFCQKCIPHYICESSFCNDRPCCEECYEGECGRCLTQFCVKCADFKSCDNCGDEFCGKTNGFSACTGGYCDECNWNLCDNCHPVYRCYYCNKSSCTNCIEYAKGDVLQCRCHNKELCSECLARREDRNSLCQDCVARAEKYLDGCMWR